MAGIDERLTFYPLRIAVLTVSDTRDGETDKSGALLVERLTSSGHELAGKAIVKDEVDAIRSQVLAWVADENIDLILSTGALLPQRTSIECPARGDHCLFQATIALTP